MKNVKQADLAAEQAETNKAATRKAEI